MPALVVHLTLVERLAHDGRGLPADLLRSLHEDLEYARFGASLPDLPFFAGFGPVHQFRGSTREVPPFARLLHGRAPVSLGLKMAELVASGSLVGSHAGQAMVTGYFSHLVLDRMMHPLTELIAERVRRPGESARAAHQRVEWLQAWYLLREAYGRDLIGTPQLEDKLKILKRRGLPLAGVGRGMFEIVRLASEEVLGVAPKKPVFDSWVRGLYLYARLLSGPGARWMLAPEVSPALYRQAFEGPGVDLRAEFERALKECRAVAARVHGWMTRGDFSQKSIGRFLAGYPEGTAGSLAG